SVVAAFVSVAALAAACGSDDGNGNGNGNMTVDPTGDHYQYVLERVLVPTNSNESSMFALNIDGDPMNRPENALGMALGAVVSQSGGELDLQGELDLSVQAGSIIVLADVQATSLATATGVGVRVLLGENPDP